MILWEGRMREQRDEFPAICRTQLMFCSVWLLEQSTAMSTLPAGSRERAGLLRAHKGLSIG